jgi:hypothetical protein
VLDTHHLKILLQFDLPMHSYSASSTGLDAFSQILELDPTH